MSVVLKTAYCGPVEYYAAIAAQMGLTIENGQPRIVPAQVRLEAHENYQKQSWRNRCTIYSASGPENLNFPIIHRNGTHNGIPITEVEIDWSTDWERRHKVAIDSAYHTSAFFDYYRDEFYAILDSRPSRLWDLNLRLTEFFLDKLGIAATITPTDDYEENALDIHPKRSNTIMKDLGLDREYFQVFSPKHGFIPGLSIMDLLFNEGPASISMLRK